MSGRVFAVQRTLRRRPGDGKLVPVHDISNAMTYGEIIDLVGPSAKPFAPEGIIQELWDKLEDYGDDDWLLCIGNPAIIALAVAIAANANEGRVKILQWNGVDRVYIPIEARVWEPEKETVQ